MTTDAHGNRFWLPNAAVDAVPEIGRLGLCVLCLIARDGNGQNADAEVSPCKMAERLGVSARSIRRTTQTLADLGLVEIEACRGRGNTNRYSIKVGTPWPPFAEERWPPETEKVDTRNRKGGQTAHPLLILKKSKNKQGDEDFAKWWKCYPKKTAKKAALVAWQKAVGSIVADLDCTLAEAVAKLQEAVEVFAESDKGRGGFCPNPTTWLNGGCYDDDPAAWVDRNRNGKGNQQHEPEYQRPLE